MFNNLRSAIRSIGKQRIYTAINIAGLTIGLSACLLVATVVVDDLSYDRDWKRSDDLYRIVSVNKMGDGLYERMASSFAGLPVEMKKLYPEVESYAPLVTGSIRLKTGDSDENGIELSTLVSDSAVWELLDLNILEGDPKKFVAGQPNIVISETTRKKYFSKVDPIGSIIYDVPAYGSKPKGHLITGVIADIPGNTHLRADVIKIDKRRAEALNKKQFGSFGQNFILLKKGTDPKNLAAKVNKWYAGFVEADKPYQFEFQSITDVYLDSEFANYQKVKGSRQNIYIFAGVAILLLLIACLNFVNLSTARSVTRLRDTAVRKVLGASRSQVIKQRSLS
jgi:putative ABC transport system permease protein